MSLEQFAPVLRYKKQTMSERVRLAMILCPGGLAGSLGSGYAIGLVNLGYGHVFDHVVGISTGAPTGGYFLTMRPDGGTHSNIRYSTVYSEEASSNGFFRSKFRMDVPWLVDVFRGSTGKAIEWQRVIEHNTTLMMVATDWKTGQPHYLLPQTEDDLFAAISASIAVPVMADPVRYQGVVMTDGGMSNPLPIDWLMAQPNPPTHVLVIANVWEDPPKVPRRVIEKVGVGMAQAVGRVPAHISQLITNRHHLFHSQIEQALRRTDVEVFVEWLPWPHGSTDRDPARIQALANYAYRRCWEVL